MCAANSKDPNFIVAYGQLTFNSEGNGDETLKPHLPPGESGVTIGRGYDVGSRKMYEVLLHLKSAGFKKEHIIELMRASGKKGDTARAYMEKKHPVQTSKKNKEVLEKIKITRAQQKKLFEIIYAGYEADVVRWLYTQRSMKPAFFNGMLNWNEVDPRMQIILVDLRYRGDFFGKSITPRSKYQKFKEAIMEHCQFIPDETEEKKKKRKEKAYLKFYNQIKDRSVWSAVPNERFRLRHVFSDPKKEKSYYMTAIRGKWGLSWRAEERENLSKPYVLDTKEGRGAVVIGRGFNLRTRHCYKARSLFFRSASFPEARDREEIVRPDFEVKNALKAVGVSDRDLAYFLKAKRKVGKKAKDYLKATENFPALNGAQQKYLYEMSLPCYESDIILTLQNFRILQNVNGHHELLKNYNDENLHNFKVEDVRFKSLCPNWARLEMKIKEVLVDLSFTGDWHTLSRAILMPSISKNSLPKLRDALGDSRNWRSPKFPWKDGRSSWVAVPPVGEKATKRFELRRNFLASEMLSPIEQAVGSLPLSSSSLLPSESNAQKAEERALIKLEPCSVCSSSTKGSFLDSEVNIDFDLTGQILPEAIQLVWKYLGDWISEASSGDDEEIPDDEPDTQDPNPGDEDDHDEEMTIEDLFTPIEGIVCRVRPEVESERETRKVILEFEDPTSIQKIGWGYFIRVFDKENNPHFAALVNPFSTENSTSVKVILSKPIHFDDLKTPSVDFDCFHDLDAPKLEFDALSGKDLAFHDLFFPLMGVQSRMAKAGASVVTKEVLFPDIKDLSLLSKGYRVRFRHKDSDTYFYVKIESFSGKKVILSQKVDFKKIAVEYVEFDIPLLLPLNKMGLGSLLGELLPSIDTVISSAQDVLSNISKYVKIHKNDENEIVGISIPINLTLYIPKFNETGSSLKEEEVSRQPLVFYCNLKFEKKKGSWLLDKDALGRFYLQLPHSTRKQIIDFGIFSLVIPKRPQVAKRKKESDEPIKPEKSDLYFDLSKREFGFTFQTIENREKEDLQLYFPGGMSDEVNAQNNAQFEKEFKRAAKKRFLFEIEPFDPNQPDLKVSQIPDKKDVTFMRLNSEGLSIKAKVASDEVTADEGPHLLKAIKFKPKKEAKGVKSQIIIVNNVIKEASVFASMLLPGFKNLEAAVSATLKQDKPGEVPSVVATLELENGDKSSLAELDLKMLQMQMDSIRLSLKWANRNWDFDAFVDGKISLTGAAELLEDLKDLQDEAAIAFKNLNLKKLNLPEIGVDIDLKSPIQMDILDKLFSCSVGKLGIDWNFDPSSQKSLGGILKCRNTSFTFNKPGTLEVEVDTSNLNVQFDGSRFNIALPNAIGLKVKLGESVTFEGSLGWVEEKKGAVCYFFAQGSVKMEGLDIQGLLKFGSLEKSNGEKAINFVLYAETDFEMELFPGIVLKRIGGGVGINNKLKMFDLRPSESEIIKKIGEVHPKDKSTWPGYRQAWEEVFKDGIYVSIIASATLASNRGSPQTFNAYIMNLIMSLDSEFNIVAAGRLWLASSLGFLDQGDHKNRPALIGALALSPREKRLGIELQSQKNPAIESSELLSTVLSRVTTRLAFRLSPELVDYHLQEVSYRDNLLGMNVSIAGHYRFAIFRRALLVKSGIHIMGHYQQTFRSGIGGFSCRGMVYLNAEYGGLFSLRGINLYGWVTAGISFEASAFIDIVFRISFKIFGKRISWSFTIRFSISLPTVQVHLRGGLAISERGAIGFEGYVGIGITICGYRLSMEPRISYQSHVVTEVRDRVKAFESLLDEAIKKSNERRSLLKFASFASSGEKSLLPVLIQPQKELAKPHKVEKWLHYFSTHEASDEEISHRECFIPHSQSSWFTPYYETESSFTSGDEPGTFSEDVEKVAVGVVGEKSFIESFEVMEREGEKPSKVKIQLKNSTEVLKGGMPLVVLSQNTDFKNIWFILQVLEDGQLIVSKNVPVDFFEGSFEESSILEETRETIKAEEGDHLFRPQKIFYTPWREENRKLFIPNRREDESKRDALRGLFFESALEKGQEELELPTTFEVIYDPRVESSSKEFMPLEAQLLPEDVWSARFQEIPSQVDLSSTNRDELKMIALYESIQKQVAHEKRHSSEDLSVYQQSKQSRAQVMKLILDDLNSLNPRVFESFVRQVEGCRHILGLIDEQTTESHAEALIRASQYNEAYILRNGELSVVEVSSPDLSDDQNPSLEEAMLPLKVRQDFVVTQDSEGQEEAKIRVSIPAKFNEAFFEQGHFDRIGTFEVYRNDSSVPIAREIQPNFWIYRHDKEVSCGTLFAKRGEPLSLPHLTLDQLQEGALDYYFILTLLPKNGASEAKNIQVHFDSELQTFSGDTDELDGEYDYSLRAIHRKTQVILEPYVFFDEIPVKNRALNFAQNYVEYQIHILPSGRQNESSQPPSVLNWKREHLFIPQKELLPDDLSIAFPMSSLVKDLDDSDQKGAFKLYSGAEMEEWGEHFDQFEIWAQEMPMVQNGFYAGESESQTQIDENQIEPKLHKVDSDVAYESSDGKISLEIEEANGTYQFKNLDAFRLDCSYKFFIRLKHHRQGHLFPMQAVILKSLPKRKEDKPKFKGVDRVEWMSLEAYKGIVERKANFGLAEEFYTKPIYQPTLGNFVHIDFEQTDLNIGGVELFYIDLDQPGFTYRQTCEVLSEKSFRVEQKDFRVSSNWKLPQWQLMRGKSQKGGLDQTLWRTQETSLDRYYFNENTKLMKELLEAIEELARVLDSPDYDWKRTFYPAAHTFLVQLALFEKSPLNIQFPEQLSLIEGTKQLLACILLGAEQNQGLDSILNILREVEDSINRDKSGLQQGSVESLIFGFDADFARRLKGVLQRRVAIVRDLFDIVLPDDIPDSSGIDQAHTSNRSLPNEQRWKLLIEEYHETLDQLQMHQLQDRDLPLLDRAEYSQAKKLMNSFSNENRDQVARVLKDQLMLKLYPQLHSSDSNYRKALAKVVPLAGAMTGVFDHLSLSSKLLKRMHHSVVIDDTNASEGHLPEKTNMIHFVPDSLGVTMKDETSVGADALYQSSDKLLLSFFNLMDYLGLSCDFTLVDGRGQVQTQDNIRKKVKEALTQEASSLQEYQALLLNPLAPNSLNESDLLDTYAFTKLALIPKNLFKRVEIARIERSVSQDPDQGPILLKNQLVFESSDPWDLTGRSLLCYHQETRLSYLVTHCKSQKIGDKKYRIQLSLDVDSLEASTFSFICFEYQTQLLDALLEHRNIDLVHPDFGKEGVEVDPNKLKPFYKKFFSLVALELDRLSAFSSDHIVELFMETASSRWATLPSKAGYSKSIWSLPDHFGHRYQCAMRKISRYEPLINWSTNTRDRFELSEGDEMKDRLNLVRLKPIEYGVERKNEEQNLLTYTYPHPRKALFSYQMPTDAARAVKNQIASVRTGYKGHDLVFYHEQIDRAEKSIHNILSKMLHQPGLSLEHSVRQQDEILRQVFEPSIKLFDHERLLTLEHLPYYFKYFFNVRTLYDSHMLPGTSSKNQIYIPATVEPHYLLTFKPKEVQLRETEGDLFYDFTLTLSRQIDYLSGRELAKEPYAPEMQRDSFSFASRDVPDLFSVYNLFWEFQPSGIDPYYLPVTSLHMPWSEQHRPKDKAELDLPRLKNTHTDFFIEKVGPRGDVPGEDQYKEWRVPIEFDLIHEGRALESEQDYFRELVSKEGDISGFTPPSKYYAYQVRFTLKISKEKSLGLNVFNDPSKFYLQIMRKGALANAINLPAAPYEEEVPISSV